MRQIAHNLIYRAFLLVGISFIVATPVRGDFMFFHDGHSYLTVTTPATWVDAAASARSRQFGGESGQLARIDNQAENQAIFSALIANIPAGSFGNTDAPDGGGGAYVWIGAADRQVEGRWIWDGDANGVGDQFWQGSKSGSPMGGLFNNWGVNNSGSQAEPDNFNSSQDAAGISLNGWPQGTPGFFLGQAGQWNDVSETNSLYYLVEFAGTPGDFDLDGDVDGRDFLVWQRNPSVGDLADWQGNYGAGSLASAVTTPEPSSILLIASASTFAVRRSSIVLARRTASETAT